METDYLITLNKLIEVNKDFKIMNAKNGISEIILDEYTFNEIYNSALHFKLNLFYQSINLLEVDSFIFENIKFTKLQTKSECVS